MNEDYLSWSPSLGKVYSHYPLMVNNQISSNTLSRKAIIVLGMHRSGTSVVSRALMALGINFGSTLIPPQEYNPKGIFEDEEVNTLNEALLEEIGCSWKTIIIPKKHPKQIIDRYHEKATKIFSKKFSENSILGLKEPRITRLLPFWENVFMDTEASTQYVLANRNPMSVADSLKKRNNIPLAHALALWVVYQLDGLAALIRNGGIIVDYDSILENPKKELYRLSIFLNQDPETSKPEVENFIQNFLALDLRHSHHENRTKSSSTFLERICYSLYNNLNELSTTPDQLKKNDIVIARKILDENNSKLTNYFDVFKTIDIYNNKITQISNAETLKRKEITEENVKLISRLRSQLEWIENRPIYRIARKLNYLIK